jgi:hypothetical protein
MSKASEIEKAYSTALARVTPISSSETIMHAISQIVAAINKGDNSTIDALVEANRDIKDVKHIWRSFLKVAAFTPHIVTAAHLKAKYNADIAVIYEPRSYDEEPSDTNDRGFTVLHCAAVGGSVRMMKFLITTYKSALDNRDYDGKSILSIASFHGHKELEGFLRTTYKNIFRPALSIEEARPIVAKISDAIAHGIDTKPLMDKHRLRSLFVTQDRNGDSRCKIVIPYDDLTKAIVVQFSVPPKKPINTEIPSSSTDRDHTAVQQLLALKADNRPPSRER